MRTLKKFGKFVLVATVLMTLAAGGYVGIKRVFRGTAPAIPEASAAELQDTQLKELRKQLAERVDVLQKAMRDLAAASDANVSERARGVLLATTTGYVQMLADKAALDLKTLSALESTIRTAAADAAEVDEMRTTLKALAAEEFRSRDETRADLLRKYR
jgi:hypothetical protein